jgi:hypothetical protein
MEKHWNLNSKKVTPSQTHQTYMNKEQMKTINANLKMKRPG